MADHHLDTSEGLQFLRDHLYEYQPEDVTPSPAVIYPSLPAIVNGIGQLTTPKKISPAAPGDWKLEPARDYPDISKYDAVDYGTVSMMQQANAQDRPEGGCTSCAQKGGMTGFYPRGDTRRYILWLAVGGLALYLIANL